VVGDREVEEKLVTLESRDGQSEVLPLDKLATHLLTEIDTKKL
jgi:threonyl-tRNA synthetase